MAKFIARGDKIQLPSGTFQVSKVQMRSLINPEYRRIYLNNSGPTHRYTNIPSSLWKFNSTTLILTIRKNFDTELEIDYEASTLAQRDQFGQLITKEDVNRAAKNNQPFFSTKLENTQTDKISNEGTTIGNLKEVNGFKSLTPFAKESETITKRAMPVKLTGSAGDGSLTVSTTNASQLTSIFGVAPAASGSLKKIVTSGSPAALLKQMQKNFAGLPPQKIRTYASNVSISPSRTIESLKPENNPSTVAVQASSKIYKDKLKSLQNNALLNFNPLSAFSGLGRSKQNLFPQFVATLLNKVGSIFSDIKNGIPSFNGVTSDLIEAGGSQTNISNYVNKGSLVSVGTPTISYVLQDQNAYAGYATPESYEYTFVNSVEELVTEFQESRRGPKNTGDDFIGGLFIHEPAKYTGPPEKANAKDMQERVKKAQLRVLTREIYDTNTASDGKTAAETAIERISIRPNDYGINSHYIILTDGSLQRGRPIDKTRTPSAYPRFYKTGAQLTILSGGTPPNAKQFETYDRFLKAWFTVFPDCGVYSTSEASDNVQNTFDVRQNIRSKYRFVYRYDDLTNLDEFPPKLQTAVTKPAIIASTSSTITKPISYSSSNAAITELAESKRLNNDINGAIKKAGAAMASLNGDSRTAISNKFGAENLPDGDVKANFDRDYKAAQAKIKENNQLINNIVNKVSTDANSVKTLGSTLKQNRGR